jgi:hypothetical protein
MSIFEHRVGKDQLFQLSGQSRERVRERERERSMKIRAFPSQAWDSGRDDEELDKPRRQNGGRDSRNISNLAGWQKDDSLSGPRLSPFSISTSASLVERCFYQLGRETE